MKERKTIRAFFAFCLLLLFAFSITPKIYFHDVIADHKDVNPSCIHPQKIKSCLHQQRYHCEVEDLVVSTPYLLLSVASTLLIHLYHPELTVGFFSSSTRDCFIHTESRGPPIV